PSIVHESSGRSRSRFVTMRVSTTPVCVVESGNACSRHRTGPARARPVALHDVLGRTRRHPLVEFVVDLERGRAAAGREALDLLDRDVGLRGVTLLEMVEHFGSAGDQARDVRAHRYDELPARTPLEHRVEGTRA